jgi:3-methyladenine DNA glycosylase AlkD
METVEEVLQRLREKEKPGAIKGMAQFGMATNARLGVSVPEIRKLSKEVGKDQELAVKLWKTGIAEARIVAAMIGEPEKVTEAQMEEWVVSINSWDVCGQACMSPFEKTP